MVSESGQRGWMGKEKGSACDSAIIVWCHLQTPHPLLLHHKQPALQCH